MFKGEAKRMLLIGNGPSTAELAKFGFHNIPKHLDTFGMVAAYRYYRRINWWPTYYGLADRKVVLSHRERLKLIVEDPSVETKKFFLSWQISDSPKVEIIPHSPTGSFCLRKSIDLGYQEIYLIGIEGDYVEEIPESRPLASEELTELGYDVLKLSCRERRLRIITSTPEHNPNYFFPDYQQAGDIYSLPQSLTHQRSFSMLSTREETKRVGIFNLSSRSKIEEFEKVDLDRFFSLLHNHR